MPFKRVMRAFGFPRTNFGEFRPFPYIFNASIFTLRKIVIYDDGNSPNLVNR